jgi:hypothetical protein
MIYSIHRLKNRQIFKGTKMTVKELIAILSRMPADATVLVNGSDYGFCAPDVVLANDDEVIIDLA